MGARKAKAKVARGGEYAPLNLGGDFPVAEPHRVFRSARTAIKAHVHECFEIGYCYGGRGIFIVEDKMLHCGKGDAVAINNRETHLLVSSPDSVCEWAFVNLDPAMLLAGCPGAADCVGTGALSGESFVNVMDHARRPDVCSIVREIVEELTAKGPAYKDAVKALVWALMVKLQRLPKGPSNGGQAKGRGVERLKPALKHIADNYSKSVSVGRLARLCCSSEPNFRRVFKKCMGVSPVEYILRFRVEIAKTLLRDGSNSVMEASLKSGFQSLSNFNRQFKAFAGCSPRQWRRSKEL